MKKKIKQKKSKESIFMFIFLCFIVILGVLIYFNHQDKLKYAPSSFRGDVNNDGQVNSQDYILIRKRILGMAHFDKTQESKADMNQDGQVNSQDYILIRKQIIDGDQISSSDDYQSTLKSNDSTSSSNFIGDEERYDDYRLIASCDNSTMKYKIFKDGITYYTLIWVSRPELQVNQGLPFDDMLGGASSAMDIMRKNSSGSSCMVGVNGSFYDNSAMPVTDVYIHNGNVLAGKKNDKSGNLLVIDQYGKMSNYNKVTIDFLKGKGAMNTFVVSPLSENSPDERTQVCQTSENGYALISGFCSTAECARSLMDFTGNRCGEVFNLDGGSSQSLLYKEEGGSIKNLIGPGSIVDLLYFND